MAVENLSYQRPVYVEQRRNPRWTQYLFVPVSLFLISLGLGQIVFIRHRLSGRPLHMVETIMLFMIVMGLFLPWFIYTIRAVVRVDSDGVYLALGFCGITPFRKFIRAMDIVEIKSIEIDKNNRTSRLYDSYTKYAILARGMRQTFFMWFGKGVKIVAVGDRTYLIGSNDPPALFEAIESIRKPPA